MIIPVNFAQANLRFTGLAAPSGAEITLGLDVELYAGSAADAAEDVAIAWASTDICDHQTTTIALTNVLVKFGPNATGMSGEYPANVPGTTGAAATPPNTAMLVQKVTGFGGRTGRGRFYIPGMSEGQVDSDGTWSPTWVTGMQTALEVFRTNLLTAGLVPVLLHGPDSPVGAPMPITSFAVSSTAATQRRRLRR